METVANWVTNACRHSPIIGTDGVVTDGGRNDLSLLTWTAWHITMGFWNTNINTLLIKSLLCFIFIMANDIIWQQWSGSKLAQVMAWCLTAPSHYLSQCWLIISAVLWHSPKTSFLGSAQDFSSQNQFEKYTCRITSTSVRANELTPIVYVMVSESNMNVSQITL